MKKGIHPDYKEITVVMSDGTEVITRSTMDTKDGVYRSEVDSKNHPFYTKSNTFASTAGRVDRFKRRYGKGNDK
jgi:large subunit ribosomal protein L31